MSALNENAVTRLSTASLVDFTTGNPTLIYTVPFNRICVITQIIIRSASVSLATASISFGYTGTTYNDLVVNGTYPSLTASNKYQVVPIVSATLGTSGQGLYVKANTTQAATVTIEIFGYLI